MYVSVFPSELLDMVLQESILSVSYWSPGSRMSPQVEEKTFDIAFQIRVLKP
jgi:hypothetical protein